MSWEIQIVRRTDRWTGWQLSRKTPRIVIRKLKKKKENNEEKLGSVEMC